MEIFQVYGYVIESNKADIIKSIIYDGLIPKFGRFWVIFICTITYIM